MKKILIQSGFLLLLLALAWLYNYPEIAFKGPQSVHTWRQTDCASLALNYYQDGMKFFHPEVHKMVSKDFTSGKAVTSEIPFLYYGIALLYKIFGYHDFIYRIVVTLIFLFGMWSLFRLFVKLGIDPVWSIACSLLVFASPVLAYYGNNFLTDVVAFSFSLAGWNHFTGYYLHRQKKSYAYAMIFLFLGMSMKISAGISGVTILILILLEITGLVKFDPVRRVFPEKARQMLPILLILCITGAWALYAGIYNRRNECDYFSTTIWPVWNMSSREIADALGKIWKLWWVDYFHPVTQGIFIILFIINLFVYRKVNKLLFTASIIIFTGVVLYCVLWFGTFSNHDYYLINLYILPVMTVVVFTDYMNRQHSKNTRNFLVRGMLVGLLIFNVAHTLKRMDIRYNGWWNEYPAYRDFYTVTPYLRSVGITRFDTVVCMPDQNLLTLYLMNQRGWTIKDYPELTRESAMRDSMQMIHYMGHGARYLVTGNINVLARHTSLLPYTRSLTGNYNSIYIFSLLPGRENFFLSDSVKDVLHLACNAEKFDSTGTYTFFDVPDFRAVTGGFVSGNIAHSGRSAVMVNESRPYGFTTLLKATASDRITLTAYQYPSDAACYLVVSSLNRNSFNIARKDTIVSESSGWQRISCEVYLPATLEGDSLKVFFWNTGRNKVFVDDFEIRIGRKYEIRKDSLKP